MERTTKLKNEKKEKTENVSKIWNSKILTCSELS